ncbi:MAG: TonB-dependent receptor [Burkholderiales bacterium]|nr:TonB-dependent receptor [Burkholderiales bacterium]
MAHFEFLSSSSSRGARFAPAPLAWAALAALTLAAGSARADGAAQTVTITGRALPAAAAVAGFGDLPLAVSPLSAALVGETQMKDAGVTQLYDLTRLEASVNDNYDAEGYWTILTVRGFMLDNRFNYRRDGLPINAETAIPLENKQRVEVLEGTSGIQAGTSAPGGLVNLVVKRPEGRIRTATLGWQQNATLGLSVDLGDRFGNEGQFGWRLNAADEHLDPPQRDAKGSRQLLALAGEWRVDGDQTLEAEVELSRQSQPSVPGFSLIGSAVPDPRSVDPRINLNDQPWTLPVVLDGATGSLRWTRKLGADTTFVAHGMVQALHSEDRAAFPFGCAAGGLGNCSDGSFELFDYRSEGEHRRSADLDLAFNGKAEWLGLGHAWSAGLLFTRFIGHFGPQVFQDLGAATVDGNTVLAPNPTPNATNTNRDERSSELHLQDAVSFGGGWQLWAGLRHTRLQRASIQTDGSAPTSYDQSFTTPWLALSREVVAGTIAYASWGQGVESNVTPNLPVYAHPGAALPTQVSRQAELGLKVRLAGGAVWSLAAFDIAQPHVSDTSATAIADQTAAYAIDGTERHRGLQTSINGRAGPWTVDASAMLLQARLGGVQLMPGNGMRPVNVPAKTLKAQVGYDVGTLPGLTVLAALDFQGERTVVPDNSLSIPGWTRLDLGARYTTKVGSSTLTWRAGVDNVTNRRAWRESPFQYGLVYLYPVMPAAAHLSLQLDF